MIVRNILAVLAAVFAAGAVIAIVEMAGHSALGADTGSLLFAVVVVGYGLGAIVASGVASRISPMSWPAILACSLLAALAVSNLFLVSHPAWFVPAAGIVMLGGFFAGRRLGSNDERTTA